MTNRRSFYFHIITNKIKLVQSIIFQCMQMFEVRAYQGTSSQFHLKDCGHLLCETKL